VIKYDTKEVIELDRGGIALGALPDISLIDQKVILKPGDCLVLYTDGVTEAFNLEDQMYGEDRLKSVLVNSCGKSARYILEIIEENLEEFRGDAPLSDDTTILAICNAKSLTNKHRDLGSP
jgi:sigma-B regulation protein RsbU (phosphoserine phosphatase)